MSQTLDINPQFQQALTALLDSDKHVFITGCAGTGKSTLLQYFLSQLDYLDTVVVAPTGVAALNVGGETIHHFLRLGPAATRDEAISYARRAKKTKNFTLYQHLDVLVIDEISMVRADLFDVMDVFLRTVRSRPEPFGGVRLICFGDLYQLPPVVKSDEATIFSDYYQTPFFFSSDAFGRLQREQPDNFEYIQLHKIYRQHDPAFIDLLDHVRYQQLTDSDLELINSRVLAGSDYDELGDDYLTLTTTKVKAQAINLEHLRRLPGKLYRFQAASSGRFHRSNQPADDILQLKVGARVMLLNNDSSGRWVNGSVGEVVDINPSDKTVSVHLDEQATTITVGPYTWESFQSVYDIRSGKIDKVSIGQFRQLPLQLAWAVTIHKAQGKTFPKIIIDLGNWAFAGGQAYVAFSRGTCLDGIYLTRPLTSRDVHYDTQMTDFVDDFFVTAQRRFLFQQTHRHADGQQETIF